MMTAFRFASHLVRPGNYVVLKPPVGRNLVVKITSICWLKHNPADAASDSEDDEESNSLWLAFRQLATEHNVSPRCSAPLDMYDCYTSMGAEDIRPLNHSAWKV